jgi:predicted phage-related endonuclease
MAPLAHGQQIYVTRRSFIGGSDARIIMGSDEAALVRLWREKRGEAEPEDLVGQPHRATWESYRGAQPLLVRAQHRPAGPRRAASG